MTAPGARARFTEYVTRFCVFDGTAFETTNPRANYCSRECHDRALAGEQPEVIS